MTGRTSRICWHRSRRCAAIPHLRVDDVKTFVLISSVTASQLLILTVMLEDLVTGLFRPSAPDVSRPTTFERSRVLTHIFPPDVLNGTGTAAVYTLSLSRADDGVLQRRPALQDEHSSSLILLSLPFAVAGATFAIKESHLAIKDCIGWNQRGSGERSASGGCWPFRVDRWVWARYASGGLPFYGAC